MLNYSVCILQLFFALLIYQNLIKIYNFIEINVKYRIIKIRLMKICRENENSPLKDYFIRCYYKILICIYVYKIYIFGNCKKSVFVDIKRIIILLEKFM